MEEFLRAYAKRKGKYYEKLVDRLLFVDESQLQQSLWEMMDTDQADYTKVGSDDVEYLSTIQGHDALPFRFGDVVVKVSKTPAEAKNATMRCFSKSFKQNDFGFAFVFPWGTNVQEIDETLTESTWAAKPLHLDRIFPIDIQHQTGFKLRNRCLTWGKPPPSPLTEESRKKHAANFVKKRNNAKVVHRNPLAVQRVKKIEEEWDGMNPSEISKTSTTSKEKYFFSLIATRYYPLAHKEATSFDLYAYFEQSAIYSQYSEDPNYFKAPDHTHQYKHSLIPERSFYMMECTDLRLDNVRATEKGYPVIIDWGATRLNYDWVEVLFNYLDAIRMRWKPSKDMKYYFPTQLPAPYWEMMFLERALGEGETILEIWDKDLLVLEDEVYYQWDFESPVEDVAQSESPIKEPSPPKEEEDLPRATKHYKKGAIISFMKILRPNPGQFALDGKYNFGGTKKGPFNVEVLPHPREDRIMLKASEEIKEGDVVRFSKKQVRQVVK
jgi:hypothetical protein